MCNCGCNTCETKGPLLTEGKVKSLLSEGLQYHIDKKIPLFETVYRIGSKKHLSLIKEARKMYSRNVIDLCEEDEALIKTHLGEFALYEGVSIPLDLPMLEENQESPKFKIGDFVQPIEGATSYLLDKPRGNISSKYVGQIGDVYINKPENLEMKDGEYVYSVDKLNHRGKMAMSFDFKESDLELISDPTDYIRSLKPYRGLNESKYEKEESTQQTIDRLKARLDDPNDGMNVSFIVQKIKDLEKSLNESYDYDEVAQSEFGMDYDQLGSGEKEWVRDEIDNMSMNESLNEKEGVPHYTKDGKEWKGKLHKMPDGSLMSGNPHDKNGSGPNGESEKLYHKEDLKEDRKYNQEELLRLDLIARRRFDCDYEKCTDEQKAEVLKDKIKVGVKEALQEAKKEIDEAEFKGKKVALGKPKRGGPKAYYVYVKDGDKVKKVTFGSGGLRAKIKNKEARNAFAARHNCKDKKDRTKAGYWSCNLPRYAPALGLGAKMNTFW